MNQFANLNQKLKNIFQIDRPDLDFGVYRILNSRHKEIADYLDNRLKQKVETYLQQATSNVAENQLENLTNEIKDEFGRRAFDEAGNLSEDIKSTPLGMQYLQLQQAGDASIDQGTVFNHLYTFFSRYYDEGDFISQRRYKGDTYAIPYAGEEVMLHWANKDQYYTKSGEMFSNYRIRFGEQGHEDKSVIFRLLSADTAKDNQKDNDKDRRFVILTKPKTITKTDEDGEAYEETINPVEINPAGTELTIWFEYVVLPKKTDRKKLNTQAHEYILADELVADLWHSLLTTPAPTEKLPQRDLLQKHLNIYTQKNTADYFIHKDLGKFLSNELDFYIKNEVMHLDNIVSSDSFSHIERQLAVIKCLKQIGSELIGFLASLEDFQKRLWLKKKFVVSSHYCITLDRVDVELYPEILANEAQWQQWQDLGLKVADAGWQTQAYLTKYPYLMVDTSLYDLAFKAKLINSIDDLDAQTDGLIINSDNFQGLNLLQEKYREQVQCIYIDPPYNTGEDGFLYKDKYGHSSWLSMFEPRLDISTRFLCESGMLAVHMDEHEHLALEWLIQDYFQNGDLGKLIWDKRNPKGDAKGIAVQHEYIHFAIKNIDALNDDSVFCRDKINAEIMLKKANELIKKSNTIDEADKSFKSWLKTLDNLSGGEKAYKNIDENGDIYRPVSMAWPNKKQAPDDYLIPLIHPITNKPCKLPSRGWRNPPSTMKNLLDNDLIIFGNDESTIPNRKYLLKENLTENVSSVYYMAGSDDELLNNFGFKFENPKPIKTAGYCLHAMARKQNAFILDYFAGSGTTAHATIALNRVDNGKRKYILVEQGEYFSTVIQPRIQKVVYSPDWKMGKPALPKKDVSETNPYQGISHCLKVVKLESYEDTLNNLALVKKAEQNDLLADMTAQQKDDYLMHYMLTLESKDSLLNVNDFKKPFDYQLNIATDSAGAYSKQHIDLVDTFNYLIGLTVKNIDYQLARGFVQVSGHLRTGEYTTVIWRDCDQVDYAGLDKILNSLSINALDSEYQLIYVNGDHNITTKMVTVDGVEKQLKVRSIEQAFLESMFEE